MIKMIFLSSDQNTSVAQKDLLSFEKYVYKQMIKSLSVDILNIFYTYIVATYELKVGDM